MVLPSEPLVCEDFTAELCNVAVGSLFSKHLARLYGNALQIPPAVNGLGDSVGAAVHLRGDSVALSDFVEVSLNENP